MIEKYKNLPLAAIGILLVLDIMKWKTEASVETLEFTRLTNKKLHHDVLVGNKTMKEKIENSEDNNGIGIAPSREIANDPDKCKTIRNMVIGTLIFIATGGIGIIALQIIQLLGNTGVLDTESGALKEFMDIMNYSNPLTTISEAVIMALEESGAIDKKQAAKGRAIAAMVVAAVMVVIIIAVAIAATAFSAGAAALPAAAAIIIAIVGIVSAVLAIVNGAYAIKKGVDALNRAKEVLALEKLQAVIESVKKALATLASIIDSIIRSLNEDIDVVQTEFSRLSTVIKIEGDTKLSIARNISI
jgi:ABC-type multidrug transport system fused ATPase/permease subunit